MGIDIELINQKFGLIPLIELEKNPEFYTAVCLTGENMSRFLSRRYSLAKPTIKVDGSKPELVEVKMVNGFSQEKTLLTIERNVWTQEKATTSSFTICIKDEKEPISTIEDDIMQLLDIREWKFPDEIRNRPFSDFVTEKSPYCFDIQIKVDTLTTYADFPIHVLLDWVSISDAFKELARLHKKANGANKTIDELYTMIPKEEDALPYALRYKAEMENLPYVSQVNHI